jgi:hypothetical protein
MSYDISLQDAETGESCTVRRHCEGGTYALGGTDEAELNVTYNYASHFNFPGLDGKTAGETRAELRDAVLQLGTQRDPDYWASTPGNCGHTCELLLRWAIEHPDAVWVVD